MNLCVVYSDKQSEMEHPVYFVVAKFGEGDHLPKLSAPVPEHWSKDDATRVLHHLCHALDSITSEVHDGSTDVWRRDE